VQSNTLAYVDVNGTSTRLNWVDRQGRILGPAASTAGCFRDMRLSPDGALLATSLISTSERWFQAVLFDSSRSTMSRLTCGMNGSMPSWTSTGSNLLLSVFDPKHGYAIQRVHAVEGTSLEPVITASADTYPMQPDVSPDGASLVYLRADREGNGDVYVHAMRGTGSDRPLVATPALDASARISRIARRVGFPCLLREPSSGWSGSRPAAVVRPSRSWDPQRCRATNALPGRPRPPGAMAFEVGALATPRPVVSSPWRKSVVAPRPTMRPDRKARDARICPIFER